MVPSSVVQILQKGKTLKLLKAAVADAGRYTCKAINIAGSTERDFYLDVLGKLFCNYVHLRTILSFYELVLRLIIWSFLCLVPPTIIGTVGSRDLSAVLNQEIILECRVEGDPFPTIQWYKDRK